MKTRDISPAREKGGSQSKPIEKVSWEATWEHTDSWVVKKFNELIDAVNELRAKGEKQ